VKQYLYAESRGQDTAVTPVAVRMRVRQSSRLVESPKKVASPRITAWNISPVPSLSDGSRAFDRGALLKLQSVTNTPTTQGEPTTFRSRTY
jgi:hypothetical protein